MQPRIMKQRLSVCHHQLDNTVLGATLSIEKILVIYSDRGKLIQGNVFRSTQGIYFQLPKHVQFSASVLFTFGLKHGEKLLQSPAWLSFFCPSLPIPVQKQDTTIWLSRCLIHSCLKRTLDRGRWRTIQKPHKARGRWRNRAAYAFVSLPEN